MHFDSDLEDVSGTYIFHNESGIEYNHILQLRKDKTFYQNVRIASNDVNYNFVRLGKYSVDMESLILSVDKHIKIDPKDPSISTGGTTLVLFSFPHSRQSRLISKQATF
jgi:hypothetical protein